MTPDISTQLVGAQVAFDSVASTYDGPLGNNALVQLMRERSWLALESSIPPGSRLLDLGCGPGLDAIHLAQRGYRVLATDWSPGMIAQTRDAALRFGVEGSLGSMVLGMHELHRLDGETFGGIYSNLGALNCIPDLAGLARSCARLLAPGGVMVATVMGRICPWEIAYYSARLQPRRAFLRFAREPVPVPLNGHIVWTRYYAPREFFGAFAAQFSLLDYEAVALLVPPPYLLHRWPRRWAAIRAVERLDTRLGSLPVVRDAGDHFLIRMVRRG